MRNNKLKRKNDNRVTLREIANITGAAYRTVAAYAQRAGWTQNGVETLLDEKQTAIIVEAMKQAHPGPNAETLRSTVQGIETSESRTVRLAALAQKRIELEKAFNAELEAELAELREKNQVIETKNERLELKLGEREDWFTIKRVAAINGIDWRALDWRKLKETSRFMELPVEKEFDANYGEVNVYHVNVLRHCYPGLRYPKNRFPEIPQRQVTNG